MEEQTALQEDIITFAPEDLSVADGAEDEESPEEAEKGAEEEETSGQGKVAEDGADEPESAKKSDDRKTISEDIALEIKYNGEKKTITRDEAIELSQKGMNYDKLKERLEAMEQEHSLIEKLSKNAGKPVAELLSDITARLAEAEIKERAKELIADGVPEDKAEALAKKLMEREKKGTAKEDEINGLKEENLSLKARDAAIKKWASFTEMHPDIKDYDSLPAEVKDAVKAGKDLDDAYNAWEVKELKDKLGKVGQVQKNKEKAPGSKKDKEGGEEQLDDFLKGFTGNF